MPDKNNNNFKQEIIKFIKFNIVGIINSGISFAVFWLCSSVFGFALEFSDTLAFATGMLNSWVLNSRWTFKQKNFSFGKILKFILVNLVALFVSINIMKFLISNFGLSQIYAKIIATPFSLLVNFAGNKLLVFKNQNTNKN